MLKQLKENHNHSHIQFILTNADGRVVESDQTVVPLEIGSQIGELHPFFMGLPETVAAADGPTVFRCVQLGPPEEILTVDVEVSKKEGHLLIVIYELTDHYREYQAMAQSRNESVIASEVILLQNDELQERERFKNEFIQNFSHELRNPLTNIISLTNILGRTDLNTEQQRILKILKESTFNLKLMLEDILSLSMISKGKLALNPGVFNFAHLMDFLQLTYTTRAKEKDLKFSLTADDGIPDFLEGDRLRLLQVLTNLCDNAVKYTNEGSIALEVALNQKRADTVNLRFGVRDTGIGISPESLGRVMESFEQLGRTEGAGLGLAIVKGLLALMGSSIQIESSTGSEPRPSSGAQKSSGFRKGSGTQKSSSFRKGSGVQKSSDSRKGSGVQKSSDSRSVSASPISSGSHFYFDLNLDFPLHQPEMMPPVGFKKKKSVGKNKTKFKILLVEDDDQVKTALFKMMVDAGDFFVDVVSDGAMVVEEMVNGLYDLVLMDVNLPNVSGDEVVKVIRSLPSKKLKNTPVIGVTAYSYKKQIAVCLNAGMNAVIAKPFDEDELLKTMYGYLE